MLIGNWISNYTFEDRYELTGITNSIIDYAKNSKEKLIILDVGCSSGIAMKYAQNYLKENGIESHTIGLDISKNVSEKAFKNLDKFINKGVLDVDDDSIGKVDVVICSKSAIFVTGDVRYDIIKKCSHFLKDEGILITDVNCFEKSTWSDILNYILCTFPTLACFKNGPRGFHKELRIRQNIQCAKKMKKLSKHEGSDYAEKILSVWNNFSFIKKLSWKTSIILVRLASIFASGK